MKIGILTFHRALNYGAVLQCYALKEMLSGMGHDVEVIDYRPPYIEKYRKLFYWKDFRKQHLSTIISSICFSPIMYRRKKRCAAFFDEFVNNHFCLSPIVRTKEDVPSGYDAIVFGSDQIWSSQLCEGLDAIFWGQFPKGKTKFISYATSSGGHRTLTDSEKSLAIEYLKAFDSISVREEKLKKELSLLSSKPIQVVLDPTLLVAREVFEKIAIKPKEENYVLLFTVEKNAKASIFAERIAYEKGCKVVRIDALPPVYRRGERHVSSKAVTPAEFCGYFKFAKFIVTVSFHGTAFSIIFNKDFYTLHSEKEERAYNLLKYVGLENRLVDSKDVANIEGIDHSNTDRLLKEKRVESIAFLKKSIGLFDV